MPQHRLEVAYIAGPMADRPNHGYDVFAAAKLELEAAGYVVLSPHDGGPSLMQIEAAQLPDRPFSETQLYRTMLRRDFFMVLQADAVFVLPDWFASNGARHEVAMARAVGTPVFDFATRRNLEEMLDYPAFTLEFKLGPWNPLV